MKKIGILTGGGDCPGLNPAIRGCVLRARALGYECLGLLDGWKGLVEAKTMPLGLREVEGLVGKGGTLIGTSRTNPFKKDEAPSGLKEGAVQKCLDSFKALGLEALVAMGGEDTLGVAFRFYKDHKLPVVGVPKTMDNDLSATDFTFGFDTSVTIAVEAAERLADTGRSHHRIMLLEVMGRHAGWVSLYTGIAAGADYVCLPERPVDVPDMVAKLKAAYSRKGYALVVASEAIDLPGDSRGDKSLDEFGHAILKKRGVAERLTELLSRETGIETRSAVIGHIQRGGPPTLFDRILSTRVGVLAADLVHQGKFGSMAALKGNAVVAVPLETATASLKTVSKEWLDLLDVVTQLEEGSRTAPRPKTAARTS